MPAAPLPVDEKDRLSALSKLEILDTAPDERFDRLTRLARTLFQVPIALISLVDSDRQWFKSCYGLADSETEREASFCAYAVLNREPLVVKDATEDARFSDNRLVVGAPFIRFYAGMPLYESGGQPIGTLCVIDTVPREFVESDLQALRDLTAMAENELTHFEFELAVRAREAAEAREAAILAAVGDGLVTIDHSGAILSLNPAAQAMFGYGADELTGQDVRVILSDEHRTEIQAVFVNSSRPSAESVTREAVARHQSGGEFPIDLTITAFRSDQGLVLIGAVRDATARKRAEAETAAALAAQQVANDELARLSRQKSEFVSIVSHEFRTALTGIRAFSEMMRDQDLSADEVKDFAGDINADALRLNRMINDILDLEKMESGNLVLRPEEVDLDATVDLLVARAQVAQATHRLVFKPGGLGAVRLDEDRLIQVVSNLLSNAIKYSPEGGQVSVRTWVDNGCAHLAIADQGVGIPKAELERVFDRYARIDADSTRNVSGTGLGLPIVRQIAQLHGGQAWAESKVGAGSTFHLLLPLGGP
ncbi:MAG TPA: ATP-binding protein [Candidatus Dormibacteraeota bacterium]|jgi:PAS domain S-box-containing protein|nr:ATP-binding protein [Candidatus Dormibacteraeota bacterium]